MKSTLLQGLVGSSSQVVDRALTVPAVAPQFSRFLGGPRALSLMGLIGFVEQACMELLAPHLEGDELSVGIDVELTHTTPTPVGATITADLQVILVEPRAVLIAVTVSDNESVISVGRHRRAILNRSRYDNKLAEKADRLP
jgi:fluoroacetyl-CoA thioesterase